MSKLLYIGSDVPNKNAAGLRVFYNSLSLSKYGYIVDILSYDKETNDCCSECIDGINVFKIPYPSSKRKYLSYLVSTKYIKQTIIKHGPYDCIIAYELPGIVYNRLRKICKKAHIKLICDCAEWHTSNHLHGLAKIAKALDIFLSMRFFYKKCDGMITISSYLSNHFKKKMSIIVPPLQEKKDYFKSAHKEKRVFMYAGLPGADKDNLSKVLDAFCNITLDFEFHIFGISFEDCAKFYNFSNDKLKKIEDEKKIIFHGFAKRDKILDFYRIADFSIIIREPTRRNNAGFPTKFSESICCLTPVISNDFSDLKEYIDAYDIGVLINSTSLMSITNTLVECIEMDSSALESKIMNCKNATFFNRAIY